MTQIIGGEPMSVGEIELLANVCDVEVLVILLCDHLKPIRGGHVADCAVFAPSRTVSSRMAATGGN